ncbi:2,3-bisphosphoglycerate-dependent phosphoglycerate mutase [Furfurilactobacillus siliginis]|uniref:2,3-bisphosphoglycerate-dependent phosphoglycerate mutase n=1 Tax=Furfurilactobacillus siliginis TaxID=348151 RepID=A0A0R2L2R0_9LACO|nr:2,3-bisphosphoglycerate-dependent phosphoglycerate mutase [Furfurilactobacillus siliginis]KRN95744.1 phosphoglycerate mutase [Furfurilactobacillus siliginis]GEK27994.1 2,3-bisphosphoglycerate-dependent phosphoglycerate mutase 1 [Furfurilactobacillus siliginis]
MVELVIIRHGESTANRDDLYTGWTDVPLTPLGVSQAHQAGQRLSEAGLSFTDVHTSVLQRAIMTTHIVLAETKQLWLPEHKSWRLNERHYGALRGRNKAQTKAEYGEAQVALWRRSYAEVPPLLPKPEHVDDRRYAHLPITALTRGESLEMAYARLMPYWIDQVAPRLLDGKNQLIVAHGSTLRALIKYLDQVSDADISKVEVPNAQPIQYTFDKQLRVVNKQVLRID